MEDNFEKRLADIRARITALRAIIEGENRPVEITQTRSAVSSRHEEVSKQGPSVEQVEKRNKDLDDLRKKLMKKKQ